ncbi:MAG: Ig-like domain-containing protein [Oscillospiraceae bacterium]|nr:Ig-like domain-containing protein [Oscillospiraceae bacterium]
MKTLKKVIFLLVFTLTAVLGITANADDVIKISMDETVKKANNIGTGYGIEFILPDLDDNKFLIDSIELAVFEKTSDGENFEIYTDENGNETKKVLLQNPESLNFQVNFGDINLLRDKAKYKIGYRYYVKSVDDFSKVMIAGESIKDGWRLVGEVNPIAATDSGFAYYKNFKPEIIIDSLTFNGETIDGEKSFTIPFSEVESTYFPMNVLQNGLKVNYTATDFDSEDSLTVKYTLLDYIENTVIGTGDLTENNIITCNSDAEFVKLILTVSDDFGGEFEMQPVTIMIDRESAAVVNEFADLGKCIKGRNLYSKFTITDDHNKAMTGGEVYYSIRKDGSMVRNITKLPASDVGEYTVDITNMADGHYEIILTMFDKAHNKSEHILDQTLDNTAPTVRLIPASENSEATLYSTWMNESKKILIESTDNLAGVIKCNAYRNYSYFGGTSISKGQSPYVFRYNVTNTMTGKIYHYFYIYDDAKTLNKSINSVNTSSSGNSRYISCYVWLDKTNPSVTIKADENTWYAAPKTVMADIYDYPSSSSVSDNSGVQTKQYCITDTAEADNNWINYPTAGITFNTGGVYYLHIKAVDYAGNVTVETKKIKINTPVSITSEVTPTDDFWHTIYHHTSGIYVVKNTAFNTKYHFTVHEPDMLDTLQTEIKLVSRDDSSVFATASVETSPNGLTDRDIEFNISYTKPDGSPLPDGVYDMFIQLSEIKNDYTGILTYRDFDGCDAVIKRNNPPVPEITVSSITNGKSVSITYPDETLAPSLNSSYIKSLYKREYKIVYDGDMGGGRYTNYTSAISPVTKPCVVTAIYTDPAGNISTASKRIDTSDIVNPSDITAKKDGNTVTIEETRPATVYYIGTRRDKSSGINNDVFKFIN